MSISTVTSADGTSIGYQCDGVGPAVVLVGGALDDGTENAALIPALASDFTVVNYTRRGRVPSADTEPYTVQREIEDLAAVLEVAVLEAAGGVAHVFGASTGAALALEAAAAGLPMDRLAVYDVPYSVGEGAIGRWRDYRAELEDATARGDTEEALAAFMRLGGATDGDLVGARSAPFWAGLVALAPTLVYDAAVLGDGGVPSPRLATVEQETLVLTRTTSDPQLPALPVTFFEAAADAVASALPRARRQRIDAPGHAVDAASLAPPLRAFLEPGRDAG